MAFNIRVSIEVSEEPTTAAPANGSFDFSRDLELCIRSSSDYEWLKRCLGENVGELVRSAARSVRAYKRAMAEARARLPDKKRKRSPAMERALNKLHNRG